MDKLNNRFNIQFQEVPYDDKGKDEVDAPQNLPLNPQNPIIDVQEKHNVQNPELLIQDPNANPILDIKEQPNPGEDKIVLRRAVSPKPDFLGRWGSFIQFVIHGRGMDKGIHLKEAYNVNYEVKIIENPSKKCKAEGKNVELHIEEEGNELPSPLHYFNQNEPVRQEAKGERKAHITAKETLEVENPPENLPAYTQTLYTVDDIYNHTMIDEDTRTREEDFWKDKESKCFTIAGVSLGIGIVALITLPIIAAVVVAALAGALFYRMVIRASEATPEVFAWRDTLAEYYSLRQVIGWEQKEEHNGASELEEYYQNPQPHQLEGNLIGQIIHPQESWTFWQDEWTAYKKEFKAGFDKQEKFEGIYLERFYTNNPYSSYTYITKKLRNKGPEHVQHQALKEKYVALKNAFDATTRQYLKDIQDLAAYQNKENTKKAEYVEKITSAKDQMMKELPEPKAPLEGESESEERKIWRDKKEEIEFLEGYHLDQINEEFKPRDEAFKTWHDNRAHEIENNKKVSRQELAEPSKTWWELQQKFENKNLEHEERDLKKVIVPEKLDNKLPISPPHLPPVRQFDVVFKKLEEKEVEESKLNSDIVSQFYAKIK